MRRLAAPLLLAGLLVACGGGHSSAPRKTFLVVVNAPFSQDSYIGETIAKGASLASLSLQGLVAGSTPYDFKVQRLDNALSPRSRSGTCAARLASTQR